MNMRNQRGRANGVIIFLIAFAIFAIGFAIILNHSNPGSSRRHIHGKHVVARGEFLKPVGEGNAKQGRYAYRGDDGNWYIYYWMMQNNNSDYYTTDAGTGIWTYQPPIGLPTGGTWGKLEQPPVEEEVLGQAPETVAEADAGTPEDESTFATENQDGIENQSVEPENTVEPS